METRDKFTHLLDSAQYAVGILGNPALTEFELVDLDAGSLSDERTHQLRDAGYFFVGAIGIVDGLPKAALSEPLAPVQVSAISQAFVALVENKINKTLAANAEDVAWLNRLWQLPDMREN